MVSRLFNAAENQKRDLAKEFGCRLSFSVGCANCGKSQDIPMAIKVADKNRCRNKKEKKHDILLGIE